MAASGKETSGDGASVPRGDVRVRSATHKASAPAANMAFEKATCFSLRMTALCVALFVRVLVGLQPHSGMNDFHGSKVAYGGDFEAQRHWMELTVNLPIGEWYYYQLQYWGLDYPPLSAYQSWLCGRFSQLLVGHESVALDTSRGYEDPTHKAFMRASVIVFELVFFTSAAWIWTRPHLSVKPHTNHSLIDFLRVVLQPSILLIDHGHFQYNTAALGLSLWAFFCFTWKPGDTTMKWPVLGSVLFCCALSFKQMTLYYAPVVFAYLLGRCFQQRLSGTAMLWRFTLLGSTVILTFAATWWPFVWYGPEGTTAIERLLHVLKRIFPFQRGLFEGKVSNIWCALSIQPFRIRDRIPADLQPAAALSLTFLMILPACAKLFNIGRRKGNDASATESHRRCLLWGTLNVSIAFFLASFQVHEKSLLMAVAPASLLAMESRGFSDWFALVATWTMWPLLVLDRLQVAYYCTMVLFVSFLVFVPAHPKTATRGPPGNTNIDELVSQHWLLHWAPHISVALTVGLHFAEYLIPPPAAMPDIFAVLWSVVGCGVCCCAYLASLWQLHLS